MAGSDGFAAMSVSAAARAAPIAVCVGHRSMLVAAGLAATLARTPGCDIMAARVTAQECAEAYAGKAQIIFGDWAVLAQLRVHDIIACRPGTAKVVLVTAGDEQRARAAAVDGEIDDHVPLDCSEKELFAVVHRVLGFAAAGRTRATRRTRSSCGGLAPGALRRVREHIECNIACELRSEELATIAALSVGHFSRAFRQSTGRSPHRYVLERRVVAASELLRTTTRALAEVALEVGFSDQSHFNRIYTSLTGETPGACRRRFR